MDSSAFGGGGSLGSAILFCAILIAVVALGVGFLLGWWLT